MISWSHQRSCALFDVSHCGFLRDFLDWLTLKIWDSSLMASVTLSQLLNEFVCLWGWIVATWLSLTFGERCRFCARLSNEHTMLVLKGRDSLHRHYHKSVVFTSPKSDSLIWSPILLPLASVLRCHSGWCALKTPIIILTLSSRCSKFVNDPLGFG